MAYWSTTAELLRELREGYRLFFQRYLRAQVNETARRGSLFVRLD